MGVKGRCCMILAVKLNVQHTSVIDGNVTLHGKHHGEKI